MYPHLPVGQWNILPQKREGWTEKESQILSSTSEADSERRDLKAITYPMPKTTSLKEPGFLSQMSFGKMVISPALGRREDFSSLKGGKVQRETQRGLLAT